MEKLQLSPQELVEIIRSEFCGLPEDGDEGAEGCIPKSRLLSER
jgi:hypothetical protein